MTEQEIISDEEIEQVHGNANFGGRISKRDVVKFGTLQCASGYYQGRTARRILQEHGLINEKYELTAKGKAYLWAAFNGGD
jgi:hypothetical protein